MFPFRKDLTNFLNNVIARSVGALAQPYNDNEETRHTLKDEGVQGVSLARDDDPHDPLPNQDADVSLEELLDLAVQAGKVNVYFHNPVVTARMKTYFMHDADGDAVAHPEPCVTGNMVAELQGKDGKITEMVSGHWEVSLLSFCQYEDVPFDNPGLNMREIIEEMQDGTIDSETVSMPDLLAAAEQISVLDITFGKRGRINRLRAVADGIELEGSVSNT